MTIIKKIPVAVFLVLVVCTACTGLHLYNRVTEITENTDENLKHCISHSTSSISFPSVSHEYIYYKCSLYPYDKSVLFYKDAETGQVVSKAIVNDTLDSIYLVKERCTLRKFNGKAYEMCYNFISYGDSTEIRIETPLVEVTDQKILESLKD